MISVTPSPRRDVYVATLVLTVGLTAGCHTSNGAARAAIEPEYRTDTGELALLRQDANHNGIPETVSHMRGTRIVRIEVDRDEDGQIDRWEHYDADQRLQKVGFSRARDGREDAWSFADASGAIVRIDMVVPETGRVARTEHFRDAALVSAEEDSDADGRIDRWETYDGGRLTRIAFDTAHAGVPTDALTYHADGSVRVETLQPDLAPRR